MNPYDSVYVRRDIREGIQEIALDVKELYSDHAAFESFLRRFREFYKADPLHSKMFSIQDGVLTYLTEHIVPEARDLRPPVLLLFGNPAPQSVHAGMYFSSHSNGSEHRIWKAFEAANILSFEYDCRDVTGRNNARKCALCNLNYHSRFRIGLAVFYSMPSPATGSWSGVAGLKRLFGEHIFHEISKHEKHRIDETIKNFVTSEGAVIAFQKDAYSAIKSYNSPDYALIKAKNGALVGSCHCNSDIKLFCCPPTRLIHGIQSHTVLKQYANMILSMNE